MQLSLSPKDLANYIGHQISNTFPDETISGPKLQPFVDRALERAEYCFSRVRNKYFHDGSDTYFTHLHTDQYAMFLYLLGNTIYRDNGSAAVAAKVYALNKALHGIDAFYEVELPDVFVFQHPIGTVLGRGQYGNYFVVYQRCSIGSNLAGAYPVIGRGIVMFGGSAIIGKCSIGDNSWLSVGTVVMDENVPGNSVLFGRSPHLTIKPTSRNTASDLFRT